MSDFSPLVPEDGEVEAEVRRLLAPPTPDQQRVIDVTAQAFFLNDRLWPTFQHVEVELDREGLDAKTVLSTFPLFVGSVRYGAFSALSWWSNLRDDTSLDMSLLGLHLYQGAFKALADTLIRDVLRLLQVFVDARQSFRTSPTKVEQLELTSTEAIRRLRQVPDALPSADLLASFMRSEPPFFTSGGNLSGGTAGVWTWMVGRSVLDYAGIGLDIEEYVRRLVAKHRSPQSSGTRTVASPLSLPASLGYLDTAWRLVPQHHAHLVVMPSPERSASLAFDATSREL
jgi:hypothetical protein